MAGIFNSAIFNNQVFNTGVTATPDTHDGFDAGHYKRYRKRLEKLAAIADEYNQSKYIKVAEKVSAIVDELQISSPVIEQIAQSVQTQQIPEFDFSALQAELSRVRKYLDDLISLREEEDDEMFIMMSVL